MAVSKSTAILGACLLTFSSPSVYANQDAEEDPSIQVPTDVSEEDEIIVEGDVVKDEVICKRQKPPTASRIARSKKVCKKQSVWEAERRAMSERNTDIYRNQTLQSGLQQSQAQNTARGGPNPK